LTTAITYTGAKKEKVNFAIATGDILSIEVFNAPFSWTTWPKQIGRSGSETGTRNINGIEFIDTGEAYISEQNPQMKNYIYVLEKPGNKGYVEFALTYSVTDGWKNEIFTQILSTFKFTDSTSSQQVLGIQTNQCCSCPTMIDASQIGKNNWVTYEQGKDYAAQRPKACSSPNIGACAPCPPL